MTAPGIGKTLRCAIYTRKSSEEGLEQDFNSLHAQREACEAYIKSQRHEGWTLVPTVYDDGGFSGGTLDRPGIKQLLADVAAGSVQIIVVYKVDRLTRSLADFARIVETLDERGASFVSITQQFNTTTSMGRLTLNVLLSFAQFEREVTGERIRDKIAASKKKGLWMGGNTPIGYAVRDRTLEVVPEQADLVRTLFEKYLKAASVDELVRDLNAQGLRTPIRKTLKGTDCGGARYSVGAVRHILKNPVYLGQIRHKTAVYPGQHPPIIDQALFDQVQTRLLDGVRREGGQKLIGSNASLKGKLFDSSGNRMTPTHSLKPDGRRYRGYCTTAAARRRVSSDEIELSRISAGVIEPLVEQALRDHPARPTLEAVHRVVLLRDCVRIELHPKDCDEAEPSTIVVPVHLSRRGNQARIVPLGGTMTAGEPDQALLRAMIRAYQWRARLEIEPDMTLDALAIAERVDSSYLSRLLPLAFLAPDLTEAILEARQPSGLTVGRLKSDWLALAWDVQRSDYAAA